MASRLRAGALVAMDTARGWPAAIAKFQRAR